MSLWAWKKGEEKATKMAEKEMREVQVTKDERKRKKNFSVNEITVITESVRKNLEIIQSKLTNKIFGDKNRFVVWNTHFKLLSPSSIATYPQNL